MTARLLIHFLAALFAFASAQEKPATIEYGPRPPLPVYDPNGFLDAKALKDISDPLGDIYKKEGVDVLVVILPDLEGAPPEHVAGRFAAAWCVSPMHAVVLHVPGRNDSPWIVPAGKLIELMKPEVIARDVSESERRASYEPTEAGKVRAAAIEATDRLRFWKGTAINRTEYLKDARAKIQLEQEAKARRLNIILLTTAASAIPLLLLVSALFLKMRKPGPRRFPETQAPRRLGAPHAGGNHAVAELGPPPNG